MNALLLKEFRENAKWAGAIVLVLVLLILGSFILPSTQYSSTQNDVGLLAFHIRTITLIGFPAAALALGLAQTLQDRRRGRLSFLVHRPISRSKIFAAKVIAGVTLYLLATTLPLAAFTVWVATPGNIAAPFDWHMLLPRLADLLGGLPWYFAALLVGAREARWVGSRLMPLGAALLASVFFELDALYFHEAVLFVFIALLVIAPAAWAAFVSGSEYESQGLFCRFLQGFCVACGLFILGLLAIGLTAGVVETLYGSSNRYPTYSYQINRDGSIIREEWKQGGDIVDFDLLGNRIATHTTNAARQDAWRIALPVAYLSLYGPQWENVPRAVRINEEGLQASRHYVQRLNSTGGVNAIVWFYVPARQTIEGYDSLTRRYAGCITPDGFIPAPQPPRPLPQPLIISQNGELAASRTTAYLLNLQTRDMRVLFTTPNDDPIMAVAPNIDYLRDEIQINADIDYVLTSSSLHVLRQGRELFSLPADYRYPSYFNLGIGRTESGSFIVEAEPAQSNASTPVITVDASGQITHRVDLPPLNNHYVAEPRWVDAMVMLAAPPALLATMAMDNPPQSKARLMFLMIPVVAVLSACVIIPLLRRRVAGAAAWTIWIILAILGGLLSVVLLLSLRDAVARRRCPHCGKLRLVDHELCEHCGEPFAPPAREGIEIFETAAV